MTYEKNQQTEKDNGPTHIAKVRHGSGKHVSYERIGAAWENPENGSLYIKLNGTQIISDGFSLYRVEK